MKKNNDEKSVPLQIYEKIKQYWQKQPGFTIAEQFGTFIINSTPHVGVKLVEISKVRKVHSEFTVTGEDKNLFEKSFTEALKEDKTFSETDKNLLNSVLQIDSTKESIIFAVWESRKSTLGKIFLLHSLPKSIGRDDQPEYEVTPLSYDFPNYMQKYYSIKNPEIFNLKDRHSIGSLINNLIIAEHRQLFAVTKETLTTINGEEVVEREELIPIIRTRGPIREEYPRKDEKIDFSTVNFGLLQTDQKLRQQQSFSKFDASKVLSSIFHTLFKFFSSDRKVA